MQYDFLNDIKVGDYVTLYDGEQRCYEKVTKVTNTYIQTESGERYSKSNGEGYDTMLKLVKQTELDKKECTDLDMFSNFQDILNSDLTYSKMLSKIFECIDNNIVRPTDITCENCKWFKAMIYN